MHRRKFFGESYNFVEFFEAKIFDTDHQRGGNENVRPKIKGRSSWYYFLGDRKCKTQNRRKNILVLYYDGLKGRNSNPKMSTTMMKFTTRSESQIF